MSSFLDEVRALEHADRPYWRVMLSRDEPVEFVTVCLQPFDEPDYEQARFLTDAIYDEEEAKDRAAYANVMMPPHMRTLSHIRVIRRAHGRS